MSKAGRCYNSASKHDIHNEGEQAVTFWTSEGHRCRMKIQIAHVSKPLLPPADLTAAGNAVSLEASHGTILNKATGKKIHLERRGRVYILRMWGPEASPAGFTRQGSQHLSMASSP